MARLMIVAAYAGSKTVKVYAKDPIPSDTDVRTGTKPGFVSSNDEAEETTNDLELKSVGTYYLAGNTAMLTLGEEGDFVADGAKPKQVFSFVNDQEPEVYVVLQTESTTDGVTTYIYHPVVIHDDVDRDGDNSTEDNVEVTARIAEATDYKHINFGVWAALGAAEKNGTQGIADLGIGFVHMLSTGTGMTADDMPNNGRADYNGNWVGTVQAADADGDGDITNQHGVAAMIADFGKGEVTVTLEMLVYRTRFLGHKFVSCGGPE